jgi:hypothetical protein
VAVVVGGHIFVPEDEILLSPVLGMVIRMRLR